MRFSVRFVLCGPEEEVRQSKRLQDFAPCANYTVRCLPGAPSRTKRRKQHPFHAGHSRSEDLQARAEARLGLIFVLALGQTACGALTGLSLSDGGDPFGLGIVSAWDDGGNVLAAPGADGAIAEQDSGDLDASLPMVDDAGLVTGDGGMILADGGWVEDSGGWIHDGGGVTDAANADEDAGDDGVCPNGQHWNGTGCAGNVRACQVRHGSGVQVWSNGTWGLCVRTACDVGYREAGSACVDDCPDDPLKSAVGICGCGVPDLDSDHDGAFDCEDGCPQDPQKTAAGVCGCGSADIDSDGDQTLDCHDACPNDINKISTGVCGCGVADTDSDQDQTANCDDGCPNDPNKTTAGVCGCGFPDSDADVDGHADCLPTTPIRAYQLGRELTVNHVLLNGNERNTIVVNAGAQIQLRVVGNVVDSNDIAACPTCYTQFYARMNNVFSLCLGGNYVYDPRDFTYSIAGSEENWSFDESITFTAPSTPGIYFINPESSWDYKCLPSTQTATTRTDGTIATLVVQ